MLNNLYNIKNFFKLFLTFVLLFSVRTIFAEVSIVRINSAAFPISSQFMLLIYLNYLKKKELM